MLTKREQPISFTAGKVRLAGVLHHPAGSPSAVVIGCHGLMADKGSPKQVALAHRCVAEGIAYFRFDHRGCGESSGDFETDTSLENRRSDLIAAVDTIQSLMLKPTPIGLFGSSFGGTVCLTSAGSVAPFAMVTLAAPVQSRALRLPEGSPPSLSAEMVEHRLSFDIRHHLTAIDHILIVHGEKDETVPVSNAYMIHRLARHPKKLLILDSGDHRISDPIHQDLTMEQALQWFLLHLHIGQH